MIGETLSHFRITDKLGEGGMGVVYRAEDAKLGREVAVKVLPEIFAQDAERMARFGREAQVLASLNHPNIAGIHQLEHADQKHFLVMELVEGETLAERIQRGAVALDEALRIALQVAAALEEAHDRGIVHRDLKPANIKITPKGTVKVLDFGLAKALEGDPASSGSGPAITQSPTLTAQMTGAGMLLGTAAYMSPEQARGEVADRRADIWAFGVVLMEMLSGSSVYAGRTVSDTLASVLAREPEWDKLSSDTPPSVRRLLERCLEKETKDRLQAIGEARIAIESYLEDPDAEQTLAMPGVAAARPAWRRALPWLSLGLAAAAAIAALAGWMRPAAEADSEVMRLSVEIPAERSILTPIGSSVVLSPDGRLLAYVTGDTANRSLYVRPLDQLEGTLVSGSELAYLPFFSPDGEWVGFVTPTELKKVSVSGGTPLTIAKVNFARGASWSPDGSVIFSPGEDKGLVRVPAAGGEPQELTTPDSENGELTHRWPQVLPGGKAALFVSHSKNGQFSDGVIEAVDLESGERKVLVRGGTYPRYARSGHLVYVREGTLYAVPFDVERLEVNGSPGPVVEEVMTNEDQYGSAQYSLSESGKLVYLTGTAAQASYSVQWVDREGSVSPLSDELGSYWAPRLSPDARRLAVDISPTGDGDIWVHDLERDIRTRLTFDEADDTQPVWSPNGEWIVFRSDRGQSYDLFRVAADGSGQPERLTENASNQYPTDWSPDGKFLAFAEIDPESSWDIRILPMAGDGEPEVFLSTAFVEYGAVFSPDGRWLAYGSNESGGWEVYVRPFPAGRGEWQVSSGGRAAYPFWSADGRQIFFRLQGGIGVAAVEASADSLRASRPEVLFEGNFVDLFPDPDYHVSPNGDRFVLFQGNQSRTEHNHLILVTNWFEELERLFGAPAS